MRVFADSEICLELTGGKPDMGIRVELKYCNGLINQKWIVDPSEGFIRYAAKPTMCIDAGAGETPGTQVYAENRAGWDRYLVCQY